MSERLAGKVALISGGAAGMGASHARAMVAHGGKVVIADIDDRTGQDLAAELGAAAIYVHLDVTDPGQWADAVAQAEQHFGIVNVLVNNAGILTFGPLGDYTLDAWRQIIDINLTGAFLGITAALPALKRAQPASIINISSAAGLVGIPGAHGYTASKWGLRGLTKSAALELAASGVRVNSVHPGGVRTPMIAAQLEAGAENLETSSLRRVAEPEEVSALVVYLASDESSFSTGAEFIVDGGITAGHA